MTEQQAPVPTQEETRVYVHQFSEKAYIALANTVGVGYVDNKQVATIPVASIDYCVHLHTAFPAYEPVHCVITTIGGLKLAIQYKRDGITLCMLADECVW